MNDKVVFVLLFNIVSLFVFAAVINDLCVSKRLSGTIQGRQDKSVFVPDIYSQSQTTWIDNFFKQNGYIGTS